MRVLLVTHRYPPDGVGGVERYVERLRAALDASGYAAEVLTRTPRRFPRRPRLVRDENAFRSVGACEQDGVAVAGVAAGLLVIATGVTHSVQDLVECAFDYVGLDWCPHIQVDESLRRGKAELHNLVGSSAKAYQRFGWEPTTDFLSLVQMLVDADIAHLSSAADRTDL